MTAASPVSADGTIGIYERKAHLSSVLEEVIGGRVVTVTRHGHPIASLQPVDQRTGEQRRAAIDRILSAGEGRTLGISIRTRLTPGGGCESPDARGGVRSRRVHRHVLGLRR
ncbi:MAG: type II toxin-antitoxin system prevent-host-death family antitoxin [Actinomycetales bacterium]|nr:type II toxin-antitoxin system prevent-host-death family antitoxin [Actinomycetales bacterium]